MPQVINTTQYGLGNLNADIADMRVRLGSLPVGIGDSSLPPNKILLYPASGGPVTIYEPTEAGLNAALTAWTTGSTVWLPPLTIPVTGGGITTGATIKGLDSKAAVNFSGFSGVGFTLTSGATLEGFSINFDGTGQAVATCVSAQSVDQTTKILNCFIKAQNATSNFGVRLLGTAIYDGPQVDKSFIDTVGGTNNVSIELGNYSFANYCYAGAKSGSTYNRVLVFIGTLTGISAPLATHCFCFGGDISTSSYGGQVTTGKTGRATDCYFEGATGGFWIQTGATLSAYADHWSTLTNAGTLIHLNGDLSGSSSTSLLGWFNVKDYGATGDGVTDDTTAIQATINAADSAGGGTVYFPEGIYVVGGALQDTAHANCQLLLPSRALSAQEITIRIKGALRPSMMWNTVSTMPAQTNGMSVIKGTLTGQTGTAALFGGVGPSTGGIFAYADYITVIFEDLMIQMPANPSYTAINSNYFGAAYLGVQIHCNEWNVATMTQPTNTNAYGVKMTQTDLQGYTHVQGLAVFGFYYGIRLVEFLNADGMRAVGCIYPYEVTFQNHPIIIQSMGSYDCPHGIISSGSAGTRLTVQNYDIEHASHVTSPAWQWTVDDLSDSGNYLYGFISWISILGGTGNDHTFAIVGGTNIHAIEIDNVGAGTGTVTSIATGTGLTGGPITTTGTISDANTGVAAATYGDASNVGQFAVNAQGRITSASNVAITGSGSSASNIIGIDRWAASSSQTAFDLPDTAESLLLAADNGSIVDPTTVALSADHTQIVFDTGITAGHIVTAEYVIAQV